MKYRIVKEGATYYPEYKFLWVFWLRFQNYYGWEICYPTLDEAKFFIDRTEAAQEELRNSTVVHYEPRRREG